MLAKFRSYRPSHATVVAYLALFVALGGSSYAAVTVTGKNVKNSSLTGKDVKNNSLTGADVKNIKSGDVSDGSLLSKDFKAGQLPVGARGPQGPPGRDGTNAATKVVVRSIHVATGFAHVDCNPGETATGGSTYADNTNSYVTSSRPSPSSGRPTGWAGEVRDRTSGASAAGTIYVVCASP